MPARLALLALAIASIAVAVMGLRDDHACTTATAAAVDLSPSDRAGAERLESQIADRCGRTPAQVRGVLALGGRGHVAQAVALARHMTRRAPEDYVGWLALGRLTMRSQPAASRAAFKRAAALNPRGLPAPPEPARRSPRR